MDARKFPKEGTYYALTPEDVLETMTVLKEDEIKIFFGLKILAATGGDLTIKVEELANNYKMSPQTVRHVLKSLRELNYIAFEEMEESIVISLPN